MSTSLLPQNGLNALHLAAKEGHVELVQELLERGSAVDSATKVGSRTALPYVELAQYDRIILGRATVHELRPSTSAVGRLLILSTTG